jgi:hypothetical protein
MKLYRVAWMYSDKSISRVHLTAEAGNKTNCGLLLRDKVLCKKIDFHGHRTRYERCPGCGSTRAPWLPASRVAMGQGRGGRVLAYASVKNANLLMAMSDSPKNARDRILTFCAVEQLEPNFRIAEST